MNTTIVATAVHRRSACHTRTVLPAGDDYGRQRCNVVLSACSVVYLWSMSRAVCSCERAKENRHKFTGTYVQNRPHTEKTGKSSYPLPKKKHFERPPRELQCSDRAEISTIGSGRPSCVDVVLGFWLKAFVRRDKFESRRKFHKYTHTRNIRQFNS